MAGIRSEQSPMGVGDGVGDGCGVLVGVGAAVDVGNGVGEGGASGVTKIWLPAGVSFTVEADNWVDPTTGVETTIVPALSARHPAKEKARMMNANSTG